ncbi:MAG: HYC_CC_PP family protein [Mangrovibacterium sp.]
MKAIFKISLSLLLVFSTLLSTTGVVFYYHTCQSSSKEFVSIYVDNTEELCRNQYHSKENACCHAEQAAKEDCCDTHHANSVSIRLTDQFLASELQAIPSISFFVLACELLRYVDDLSLELISEDFHFSPPLADIASPKNYGKILSIRQHKLKLDC